MNYEDLHVNPLRYIPVFLATCAWSIVAAAQDDAAARAILQVVWQDGVYTVAGGTLAEGAPKNFLGGSGDDTAVVYSANDVVAEIPFELPNHVYACLADDTGALSGGRFETPDAAFALQVPWTGESLLLDLPGSDAKRALLEVDSSIFSAPKSTHPVTKILNNGPDSARLTFAIVAEGYRASEMAKFRTDAADVLTGFLSRSPWNVFAGYVNAYAVEVASAESGADHPAQGIFKNTALDASYNFPPIERLLTVAHWKAFAAAASAPTYDLVLVIVNDEQYGGAGGSLAVISTDNAAVDLAIHEMGHTFPGLADEYESVCPTCPPYSGEPNVTAATSRNNVPWKVWIDTATPVPTPEASFYSNTVGVYEGARYLSFGMYRPKMNCMMRQLGVPFCEVCRETHVLELYRALDIDPIVNTSPPRNTTVTHVVGTSDLVTIQRDPDYHASLGAVWYVDDAFAGVGDSINLFNLPLTVGGHTLRVVVRDLTGFVRNDPEGLVEETAEWTLEVLAAGSTPEPEPEPDPEPTPEPDPEPATAYAYLVMVEEGEGLVLNLPVAPSKGVVRWFKDEKTVRESHRVSGAGTQTVTISPAELTDSGTYRARYLLEGKRVDHGPILVKVVPAGSLPASVPWGLVLLALSLVAMTGRVLRRQI